MEHPDPSKQSKPSSERHAPQASGLFFALAFETLLGSMALLFAWLADIRITAALHLRYRDFAVASLFLLPMLLAFLLISKIQLPALVEIREKLSEILQTLFGGAGYLDFALISVQAGVCEELFFRGWLEPMLSAKIGWVGALIATNIFFGLGHLVTRLYGLIAALLGAWISYATHYTDNLLVAICIHAVYDFLALSYHRYRLTLRQDAG